MQSLILIKNHPCVQLAHLYEHLYCNEVKKLLYDKGLFKYIDFSLRGSTYEQGGVIEIDFELYSPEVKKISDILTNLAVDTEKEDSLNLALRQLCSEEEGLWSSYNLEQLQSELEKLSVQPWRSIEQFGILDTKSIRRSPRLMFIEEKRLPSKKLFVTLSLDQEFAQDNRSITPLFKQLSRLLARTATDYLGLRHGDYVFDDHFTKNSMKTELWVYKGAADLVDLSLYMQTILKSIQHQLRHRATDRLLDYLQSLSYTTRPYEAPSTEDTLHDTGIYVGAQGWQEIATHEHIEKLWPHMSVAIQFGRKKVTEKLSALL